MGWEWKNTGQYSSKENFKELLLVGLHPTNNNSNPLLEYDHGDRKFNGRAS